MDEQKIPVFDDSLDEEELVQAFAPPLPEMKNLRGQAHLHALKNIFTIS